MLNKETIEAREEFENEFAEELKQIQINWDNSKKEISNLIEAKYFDFVESHESYQNEGIVDIIEVDDRKFGYINYPHCKELGNDESLIYIKHITELETFSGSEYEGEEIIYWVWQTCGYLGDDYSGYLLLPLNDGRYWKISYSC